MDEAKLCQGSVHELTVFRTYAPRRGATGMSTNAPRFSRPVGMPYPTGEAPLDADGVLRECEFESASEVGDSDLRNRRC